MSLESLSLTRFVAKALPREVLAKQLIQSAEAFLASSTSEAWETLHFDALLITVKGFDDARSTSEILKSSQEVKEVIELHKQVKNISTK